MAQFIYNAQENAWETDTKRANVARAICRLILLEFPIRQKTDDNSTFKRLWHQTMQ